MTLLVGSIFHMTRKIVSEMTYNMSMGTLNPTIPYLDRRPSYAPKTKFKMAAATILNLLPVAIFNILPTFHCWLQPPHKISCKYLRYRIIITLWNSRWRLFAILDFRKLDYKLLYDLRLLKFHHCTIFSAKILIDAQIMAQKRNSKWRRPPRWIYFRWLFLTYSRLSTIDLNHQTKFRANISIRGWLR